MSRQQRRAQAKSKKIVRLGMIPDDFCRHYTDNCGMTVAELGNLWFAGGEEPGWKVGKFIINLYIKEHGVPPSSWEQEYQYALTKEHLLKNMSWAELEEAA